MKLHYVRNYTGIWPHFNQDQSYVNNKHHPRTSQNVAPGTCPSALVNLIFGLTSTRPLRLVLLHQLHDGHKPFVHQTFFRVRSCDRTKV